MITLNITCKLVLVLKGLHRNWNRKNLTISDPEITQPPLDINFTPAYVWKGMINNIVNTIGKWHCMVYMGYAFNVFTAWDNAGERCFSSIKTVYIKRFLYVSERLITNRLGFSVICTFIGNDICHHSDQNSLWTHEPQQFSTSKKMFISERDQNSDKEKEQELSWIFSQYDWFTDFPKWAFLIGYAIAWPVTRAWREQRCQDSYRQRQISQSDCYITSNCGKK